MTLLKICQDVADEVKDNRPGSIVGNEDPTAQVLLRLAQKVGRDLMESVEWQVLRKEQTFTAVAGENQANILPDDFNRFVKETFWDRTNKVLIAGPIQAVEWQSIKAQGHTYLDPKFIHRGNAVSIYPAMGGGESLAFEYVSDEWCTDSAGTTGQTAWAADTDVSLIDEELITLGVLYEHLASEGQPAGGAFQDFKDRLRVLKKSDQPRARILSAGDVFGRGRHYGGAPLGSRSSYLNGF